MKQIVKKTVLDNGITILSDYMPHAYSVAVGVWVPRGSRHEAKDEYGLSHFYEHLVFKGTENRTALEIARSIEDKGGNLEAYTTRQETGFYAQIERSHLPLAVDVIADMLMHPRMDKKEMEKERRVIIEEIHSYDDIPEEIVGDVFNAIHFKGCGIAHSITGNIKQVKSLTHRQMLKYREQVTSEIPRDRIGTSRSAGGINIVLNTKCSRVTFLVKFKASCGVGRYGYGLDPFTQKYVYAIVEGTVYGNGLNAYADLGNALDSVVSIAKGWHTSTNRVTRVEATDVCAICTLDSKSAIPDWIWTPQS